MMDNIPYVDRLREQLLAAGRLHPNPPRVPRIWKLVAGVFAAVLVIAGVVIPLAALRGFGPKSASVAGAGSAGAPPITGQLVATTINLQPGIGDITVGFGDVWVIGYTSLTRLDETSGKVVATVPISSEDHAAAVASAGSVWVSDGLQTIREIDPVSNQVTGTLEAPGRIEGLAVAEGEVWASVDDGSGSLLEIDPATDQIVKEFPVGEAGSLSSAGGSLWIDDTNGGGTSVQFNLSTDSSGIKLDDTGGGVVFGGGLYWAVFNGNPSKAEDSTIVGIDPATGDTIATLPAPRAALLAASPDGVWVFSVPGSLSPDSYEPDPNQPATVSLIDPVARAFVGSPVPVDISPARIVAGDGALWVSHFETGTVTKVVLEQ